MHLTPQRAYLCQVCMNRSLIVHTAFFSPCTSVVGMSVDVSEAERLALEATLKDIKELRAQWSEEKKKMLPDFNVEWELAEMLLKSRIRSNVEEAFRSYEGLAVDGFDQPQLLSLRLAQCCMELGKYRECEAYLLRGLELPQDDPEGQIDAEIRQLQKQLSRKVVSGNSTLAFYSDIFSTSLTFLCIESKQFALTFLVTVGFGMIVALMRRKQLAQSV